MTNHAPIETEPQLIYRTLAQETDRAAMLAQEHGVAYVVVFRHGEWQAHVWHASETTGLDVATAVDPDGTRYEAFAGGLHRVEA